MKRVILSIFLIFLFGQVQSQVSGYLGKRAIVEISYSGYPAVFGPTYFRDDVSLFSGRFGLNSNIGISTDYVISRKRMIGFRAAYMRTGFIGNIPAEFISDHIQTSFYKVGFRYSFFNAKKGGTAPLGRANSIGFDVYSTYAAKALGLVYEVSPNYSFGVSYQWSNRHIIGDRFLLKYGAEFSFVFPILSLSTVGQNFDDILTQNDIFLAGRLFTREFYKMEFSVGYLIF